MEAEQVKKRMGRDGLFLSCSYSVPNSNPLKHGENRHTRFSKKRNRAGNPTISGGVLSAVEKEES